MKIIFIFVPLLSLIILHGQELTPIPDLNFWNEPYNFQLHNCGICDTNINSDKKQRLDSIISLVVACYAGNLNIGCFQCKNIDTNPLSLLKKAERVFAKQSIINLDYYDGTDSTYKLLIEFLYNSTISDSTVSQQYFFGKAQIIFDKIPVSSIYKAISFIQIDMVRRLFIRIGDYKEFNSLQEADSISNYFKNHSSETDQELGDWNEVMGDFWYQYGYLSQYFSYYTESLKHIQHYHSNHANIQLQRLHEKLLYDLSPNHVKKKSFEAYCIQSLNDLTESPLYKTQEFYYHYRLLLTFFYKDFYPDSVNLLNSVSEIYWYPHMNTLNSNILMYHDLARPYIVNTNDLELQRKFEILWFNITANLNLIRWQRYDYALTKLYDVYLHLKEYDNASIVNEFIGRSTKNQNSETYMDYLINKPEILCYQGRLDSAAHAVNDILSNVLSLNNYGKERCYRVLKAIAYNKNNLDDYIKYDDEVRKLDWDATEDYGGTVKTVVNNTRDDYDKSLFNRIEEQKASARRNFWYTIAASLSGLIIALFIFIIYILQIRNRAALDKAKAKEENAKLETETAKLELESLRAPYLNHAIGDNFQHIINQITIGMKRGESLPLESAIKIAKGQSELFSEIIKNSTGVTSLKQEIEHNSRYLNLMSHCLGKEIRCVKNINSSVADNLIVPAYFLLDIFINAISHGKLASIEDAKIIIALVENAPQTFTLSIADNGIGLAQSRKENKDKPSTGLDRVTKRLVLFNKSHRKNIFSFDKLSNVKEIRDKRGRSLGTIVTIGIKINDDDQDNHS